MKRFCVVNADVSRWHIFTTSWKANLCVCRCMCHCLYLCLCICLCICACLIVGYHFRWKDLALSTPTSQGGKYLHWWHIWWHIFKAYLHYTQYTSGISPLNISLLYLETSLALPCLVLSSFERGKCQRLLCLHFCHSRPTCFWYISALTYIYTYRVFFFTGTPLKSSKYKTVNLG